MLLTSSQVAEQLAVSVRTVERLVERGELVATRVGRSLRFTEADVAAFVERAREPRLREVGASARSRPAVSRPRARQQLSFREQLRVVA